MTMHLRRAPFAAACLLSLSLALSAHAEEPADVLYREGTEALSAGNTPLAYEKLKAAFAIRPSVDIAANLALVEQKLGHERDAAEHLAFAIKVFPPSGKPEVKQRLQEDLTKLEEKLAKVEVQCPGGTTLQIGDRTIGLTPVDVQYLAPGKHMVQGKHPEHGNAKVTIEVTPGQKLTVTLELQQAERPVGQGGGPIAPPPGERPEPEEEPTPKPWWPYEAFGGVAAAGLGVGLGLSFAAGGKRSDADDIAATIDGGCSEGATDGACGELVSAIDAHNGLRVGSFVGFGVAGAAAVGALVYALLPGGSGEISADTGLLPVIGPTDAGFSFRARF
jgi:hypothetical protein